MNFFDTAAFNQRLIDDGVDAKQAKSITGAFKGAIQEVMTGGVATKADLIEVKAELKADMAELKSDMKWIKVIGGAMFSLCVALLVAIAIAVVKLAFFP